ncbi:hypothetical protein OIY81_1588 [Cryptosporidium canis]|uniref:WD domain-containing protein n=1 Tax=Cryptosporidium canis TaxID=195482 RepID=A0ABQ8P8F0_9CRYT|nr:hypothetical protein OJ252_1614 [Cryptosporidium canis]KAJ1611745.1 hypothetical protein OIY81_1588 [Cryptosporidium canis]
MDLLNRNNSLIYCNELLIWFQKNKLFSFSPISHKRSEIVLGDETPENNIISMNISGNGIITVGNNSKLINIVKIHHYGFELLGQYLHSKRLNISIYRQDKSEIIIGDKFGDLYSLSFNSTPSIIEQGCLQEVSVEDSDDDNMQESSLNVGLVPKTGHLSTITCSAIDDNNKFLFTGNKCGKIWVSNIDNLENTVSILCGHSDAVSSICEVNIDDTSHHFIVSSSFDRRIKLWNYLDGTEIDTVNLEVSYNSLLKHILSLVLQFTPLEIKYSSTMKKVFIRCESLCGIIAISLTLDDGTRSYRLIKDCNLVSLNTIPYSLEINDINDKSVLVALEEFANAKATEGAILWYMDENCGDLPKPIAIYSCGPYSRNIDTKSLDYSVISSILLGTTLKKASATSESVCADGNCLKRVKKSDE